MNRIETLMMQRLVLNKTAGKWIEATTGMREDPQYVQYVVLDFSVRLTIEEANTLRGWLTAHGVKDYGENGDLPESGAFAIFEPQSMGKLVVPGHSELTEEERAAKMKEMSSEKLLALLDDPANLEETPRVDHGLPQLFIGISRDTFNELRNAYPEMGWFKYHNERGKGKNPHA